MNLNNLDAHWNEIAELIKPDGQVAATTENHRLIDLQKLTKKQTCYFQFNADNMKKGHIDIELGHMIGKVTVIRR